MHKYEVIIHWSDDDQASIAEVPGLPGCAGHARTPSEAPSQCHEATDLWLATAREFGRQIPEPKGKRLIYA